MIPEASDQSPEVRQRQGSMPNSGQIAEICIANFMPLESQSRAAVEDNKSESSGGFPESEAPNFIWGADVSGEEFCARVNDAYEVIKWRHNIFLLPFGKASKMFVQEVVDLLQAFAQKTSQKCIAIKACLLM